MNSWTWNPSEERSSFSGRYGSEISRTTTRWLPTPSHPCRPLKPPSDHSLLSASDTAPGSRTSPLSTAPGGSATWLARPTVGGAPTSSAAPTAVEATSPPPRRHPDRSDPSSPSGTVHLHRARREVLLDRGAADPIAPPDAHGRELAALDQPVHRHGRDAHRRGHLGDREQGRSVPPEGPSPAGRHRVVSPAARWRVASHICHTCHKMLRRASWPREHAKDTSGNRVSQTPQRSISAGANGCSSRRRQGLGRLRRAGTFAGTNPRS